MWSSTNVFICNMALSDLAICLFAVPITPLTAFTGLLLFSASISCFAAGVEDFQL
jgi:hypothetical protein